jgi:hypothetical protein
MLLWSFEGERGISAARFHKLGGHGGGETPLPIPNREVKPASADGTRRAISRESRTPPISLRDPETGPSFSLSLIFKRRAISRANPDRVHAAGGRARQVGDA